MRNCQFRCSNYLITEKQQVDIQRYQEQIEADVKAYTAAKIAEGELDAADKQKQAMLILAEGDSESNKRRAVGEQAKQMVPVDVDREKVGVEAARVEVRRQDLENQEKFSDAALDFELKKAQIIANKEVQIQMADAVGTMMASAKMQLFGDPTTAAAMMGKFLKSVGWGLTVDGLVESTPDNVREMAEKMLTGTGSALSDLVGRFTGKKPDIDPAVIEKAVAEAIAEAGEAELDAGTPAAPEAEPDKPEKGNSKGK